MTPRAPLAATGMLTALVLTLPAVPAATAQPAPAPASGIDTLAWEQCPAPSRLDPETMVLRPDFLCATTEVPLDHAVPEGRTIPVLVTRITSTGPRSGVLFGNPGGPGGDARYLWAQALDAEADSAIDVVRRDHDLVAVQPRGLSGSGDFTCDDSEEVRTILDAVRACMRADPDLVRSIHTENVTRDFDLVRERMGLERISYLGYSYGTAIGMMYQTLFPERLHRLVLDSATGPTEDWWAAENARTRELRHLARNDYLTWIARHDDVYRLGATPLQVYHRLREFDTGDGLEAGRYLPPPATPADRGAGVPGSLGPVGSLGSAGTGSTDLEQEAAVRLDNLRLALTGRYARDVAEPTSIFALLDQYTAYPAAWSNRAHLISALVHGEPLPPGPEPHEDEDEDADEEVPGVIHSFDGGVYITISDCNENTTPDVPLAGSTAELADSLGSSTDTVQADVIRSGAGCAFPPVTTPPPTTANPLGGNPAVRPLVLQSDLDAQTPAVYGERAAAATGGVLVRVEGPAHGLFQRNPAVDPVVLDYLATGTAPEGLHLPRAEVLPGPRPW